MAGAFLAATLLLGPGIGLWVGTILVGRFQLCKLFLRCNRLGLCGIKLFLESGNLVTVVARTGANSEKATGNQSRRTKEGYISGSRLFAAERVAFYRLVAQR